MLKGKTYQGRILDPVKISLKNEGELETSHMKKPMIIHASRPALKSDERNSSHRKEMILEKTWDKGLSRLWRVKYVYCNSLERPWRKIIQDIISEKNKSIKTWN